MWELVNAFSAPIDRLKVHDAVAAIRGSDNWKVEYATFKLLEEGLLLHRQRSDKHWSLTDCISFVIMQQHGVKQALAFDRDFEQAGFEALMRRDPP